jgi:hypothetical protein
VTDRTSPARQTATRVVAGCCCVLAAALLLTACGSGSDPSQKPFPNYGFKPPASEYNGPLFKLSQDYPTQKPKASELPGFFKIDFRKDWRTYMMQVREYCLEGNAAVEWRVEKNKVRRWYHMPWQDYGAHGREGIHGLTVEAPIQPLQLAPAQTYSGGEALAIGIYNSFGGYAIGQVWKNHTNPDPEFTSTQGFPVGTVVCKALFVRIPPKIIADQIPYLVNPVEWRAYAPVSEEPARKKGKRAVQPVTLIQLDIMIRDERAASGWIFGTFEYNGALRHANRWKNLVPVGLMWGNDPENPENIPVTNSDGKFPAPHAITATPINPELKETVINPRSSELPPTHLGWNGRLDGPVDNPLSSCMSCHMTASSPRKPLSPLFVAANERPKSATPEWDAWWMQWFQNVGWKNGVLEKFMNAKHSLDFSLQLDAALQSFIDSKKEITPENLIPEKPVP